MIYILVAALTFGVLFLIDKGFARLFRSKAQHQSGNAVRPKKNWAVFALVQVVVGILCIMAHVTQPSFILLAGGVMLIPGGAVMGLYYMTHGVFYDEDTFYCTTFGNRSVAYRYADIVGQKLYAIQGGSHVVELHMADGKTVSIQTNMEGAFLFLDKAAHARLRQLGQNSAGQDWFDEDNSCWFPPLEG